MKKLIVAVAAIVMATASQAATINWAATKVYTPGTETAAAGYVAYLFNTTTAQTGVVASILDGSFATSYVSSAVATATTTEMGAISKTGIGNYGAGDSADMYMVIFDAGTYGTAAHYAITDSKQVAFTSATGSKAMSWTNFTATQAQWAEIAPEPTSGLLLLIGMAGLALKRKQA